MPDPATPEHTHDCLHTALAAVQRNLPHIAHDATGGRGNRYATLATIQHAVLPLLAEQGLSWTCIIDGVEHVLRGVLTYGQTGEAVTSTWSLPDSRDAQTVAVSITYGRRYLLSAMVGVASDDDDDDGESATPPAARASRSEPAPVTKHVNVLHEVQALVKVHVPADQVESLCDAYTPGATALDELSAEAATKMWRALGNDDTRKRVLEGLAAKRASEADITDVEPCQPGCRITAAHDECDTPTVDDVRAAARDLAETSGTSAPTTPADADTPPADPVEHAQAELARVRLVAGLRTKRLTLDEVQAAFDATMADHGGAITIDTPADFGLFPAWAILEVAMVLGDAADDGGA